MKRSLIAILLLFFISSPAFAEECINWPKVMAKYDIDHSSSSKKVVVVQTFEDFTKLSGDDWLATGLPYLLTDYLNTGRDVTALFGPYARFSSAAVNPEYVITGMYQHIQNRLRVFIKMNKGGELIKQWQLDINYPQNKQIFDTIGDTAISILALLSPHYDNAKYAAIIGATPSVPAYENFIRGMLSYWEFNPDKFDVVRTWFDESKKADLYYQNAYKAMTDLYLFMGLYSKQYKRPYAGYFEQAQKEINLAEKFLTRPPLPDLPKKYVIIAKKGVKKPENRFLLGNAFFVAGLNAAGQQQWMEAANQFEKAAEQVPEDAITWWHLAKMRENTGDQGKASEARAKALEINGCLQ